MLQRQRDLFLLAVHAQDVHFKLLVDVDTLAGVGDARPVHVGNVQQAVDAAEVHEGAELGDVLDGAGADLPLLNLGQELRLHLGASILQQLPAADDDVAACLVDLEDLALNGFADEVADVRRTANVHLTGGQKDIGADVDEQTALDLAGDGSGDDVALLVLGDNRFPLGLTLGLAVGQDDGSRFVLGRFEQQGNLVAGTGRHDLTGVLVIPLAQLDGALALVADVQPDLVAGDAQHAAGDDAVFLEVLGIGGQPVLRPLHEDGLQLLLEQVVGEVILAEQVAVYHLVNSSLVLCRTSLLVGKLPPGQRMYVGPGEGQGQSDSQFRQAGGGRLAGQLAAKGVAADARDADQQGFPRGPQRTGQEGQPHHRTDLQGADRPAQLDVLDAFAAPHVLDVLNRHLRGHVCSFPRTRVAAEVRQAGPRPAALSQLLKRRGGATAGTSTRSRTKKPVLLSTLMSARSEE